MIRGTAWMVSMRWSVRAIGLVNIIILARLLTPEDFGIVAMAMIFIALLTEMAETNVEIALVRNEHADTDDYNSAWTLKILTGGLITVALLAIAPLVARYFGDDRVELVIQIVALRAVIVGFENIGVVDFRKDLDFAKEFRYWIFRRLSLFVIALGIALALRDYRALAIAAPVSAVLTVALSYMMSSYRPKFCVARIRALWSFSQWLIVDHVSRFVGERIDQFVIGGLAGATNLGHYFMASEVSAMPTREVVVPAGRALIPTYAKVAHDEAESRRVFLDVFGFQAAYALPAGIGVAVVAGDLVPLLLGGQWAASIPFFQWLGIYAAFEALVLSLRPYFMARGGERPFALTNLCYLLVLVPAVVAAGHLYGIEAIAMARTATMIGLVIAFVFVVARLGYATFGEILSVLWRPLLASVAMWFGVQWLHDTGSTFHIASLARDAATGAVLFTGALYGLWFLAGRPDGAERSALTAIGKRF